jgi:hypothetical protein
VKLFEAKEILEIFCFLFCLYHEYFSLASVGVRSAAKHLQPNLYHNLEWKNQQIKRKKSARLELNREI